MGSQPEGRERRPVRRRSLRVRWGALLGAVLGAMLSTAWGLMLFRLGSAAMWGAITGTVLVLGGVGAVADGMLGVEPPDPGAKPSGPPEEATRR